MKRLYSGFRLALMAFGLGLAAVYMWQQLSLRWWGVPVDLPEARSASVLEVAVPVKEMPPSYLCDEFPAGAEQAECLHQVIFQGRDMSQFDNGGSYRCTYGRLYLRECEPSIEKARRFVWEHWKKRDRGFVVLVQHSLAGERKTHLFIEPKGDGSWRIAETTVPMLRERTQPEHYRLGEIIEVEWKRETADREYGFPPGTRYLKLTNPTGDWLIL